jgi:hypothetical protein
MLVRPLVGLSVGWLVYPHITSKTDYVAIPSRLGLGDPLVLLQMHVIDLNINPGNLKNSLISSFFQVDFEELGHPDKVKVVADSFCRHGYSFLYQ